MQPRLAYYIFFNNIKKIIPTLIFGCLYILSYHYVILLFVRNVIFVFIFSLWNNMHWLWVIYEVKRVYFDFISICVYREECSSSSFLTTTQPVEWPYCGKHSGNAWLSRGFMVRISSCSCFSVYFSSHQFIMSTVGISPVRISCRTLCLQ